MNALWNDVEAYNAKQPIPEAQRERLFFYFGQYVEERGGPDDEAENRDT